MKITCPYCGGRNEDEFHWGGPSEVFRPISKDDPAQDISDEEWADYLHMVDNVKGDSAEIWCHSGGCGQWFNVIRSSVTHKISHVYKMGEPRPTGENHD